MHRIRRQGQHLLAHELVHVVQQTGGVRTKRQLGEVSDPYKQADVRATEQMITRSWPAESSKISEAPSGAVQRVAGVDDAAELGVLLWCVSGALTTIAIDEAIQGISWLWKGGNFRQNWCKTLFSALFGCIFGVAGGAFGKMFLSEGVAITTSAMLRWLIKKAITAGFTQLAGKLGLILAKSGCDQQEKVADATPAPDTEGAMDTSETAMA